MNDDRDFLRRLFGPFDPAAARPSAAFGRLADVVDFRDSGHGYSRRARGLVVMASAAAVAALVAGGVALTQAGHSRPSSPLPGAVSAAGATTSPIPGFDHTVWQDWSNGTLLDTADRWISADGHGKITETNGSGQLTSSLTIVPAPTASASSSSSRSSPTPTPGPTSGTEPEPVEYPGAVPVDAAALRAYLASGDNDKAHIGQRLVGLVFGRALSPGQQTVLIGIAKNIAEEPITNGTAPNGQPVELVPIPPLPMSSQWWLAISPDGTSVVGTCYDEGQQIWRILLTTKHQATIN